MRKIIYSRPDGGVSVVHPVINTIGDEGLTEAEAEQRAWDKLPANAINPQWADVVPADRAFRNAWKINGGGVEVDMPKAREIHRNRLRELRKPRMEALDAAYMRADEIADTAEKSRIAVQKQALRDAPADPAIEAAQTPGSLKAVIPAALR